MNASTLPAMLSTTEAAARLNVSPRTLEKWRTVGGGPRYHLVGVRRVAYAESDLVAFVEKGARAHTSEVAR
ncbi:helix-turn-helix transcriptional regulator [Siculibacillus lacustris]|nr:helix-turn-helix domain-containing protein [Siculibacillus lacustris]